MGTRADFYVGRGEKAEWLGSIAFDGYPEGVDKNILWAACEQDYRNAVAALENTRSDFTKPEMGWPWPWEDSNGTDYAYTWEDDSVIASSFGSPWFDTKKAEPCYEGPDCKQKYPNMKAIQKVTFGERSGVMLMSHPKDQM